MPTPSRIVLVAQAAKVHRVPNPATSGPPAAVLSGSEPNAIAAQSESVVALPRGPHARLRLRILGQPALDRTKSARASFRPWRLIVMKRFAGQLSITSVS